MKGINNKEQTGSATECQSRPVSTASKRNSRQAKSNRPPTRAQQHPKKNQHPPQLSNSSQVPITSTSSSSPLNTKELPQQQQEQPRKIKQWADLFSSPTTSPLPIDISSSSSIDSTSNTSNNSLVSENGKQEIITPTSRKSARKATKNTKENTNEDNSTKLSNKNEKLKSPQSATRASIPAKRPQTSHGTRPNVINFEDTGTKTLNHDRLVYDAYAEVFVQPRGLNNVKNSCYLNSVLQALLYTPPFYNLFNILASHHLDKTKYPLTKKIIRFVKDFPRVSTSAKHVESGKPFTPDYLLTYFRQSRNGGFASGIEHDAHEFVTYLLEALHEELKESSITQQAEVANMLQGSDFYGDNPDGDIGFDDGEWEEVGKNNKTSKIHQITFEESPVSKIFCGKMRSHVKKKHTKGSLTLQPFYSLHLYINDDYVKHIKDGFQNMTIKEQVSDIRAMKQIAVEEPPQVLILHLKRFIYDAATQKSVKISKKIQFGVNLLLDQHIVPLSKLPGDDIRRMYELTAVVCHHGVDPSSGHYSTYVQHPCDKWIHMDDSKVTPVSLNHVLDQQAYLLFYVQQSLERFELKKKVMSEFDKPPRPSTSQNIKYTYQKKTRPQTSG